MHSDVSGTSDNMKMDNGSASEEETTVVVTEKDVTGVSRLQEEPQPILASHGLGTRLSQYQRDKTKDKMQVER